MSINLLTAEQAQEIAEKAAQKAIEGARAKWEEKDTEAEFKPVKYFAIKFGVQPRFFREWAKENNIPFRRLGRTLVFCIESVEEATKVNPVVYNEI